MALNDNSQFNADGAGSNDHQSGWLRALAMGTLGILPGQASLTRQRAGVYSNSVPYAGATTAGDGVMIIATVAGTATVTMAGGGSVVVPAPVGATILPLSATNVVQTTGTLTAHKLTF